MTPTRAAPRLNERVSRRTRTWRYGACIAVVLAGVACAVLINGVAGGTAATVLVGFGFVGIISLVFYEVGLTEDRDLARGIRSPYLPGEGRDLAPGPAAPGDHPDDARGPAFRDDHPDPADGHRLARPRPLDRRRGQRRRLR
jgi:hypothetical protein